MCGSKSNEIKTAYCLLMPLQIGESRLAFNNEIATVTSRAYRVHAAKTLSLEYALRTKCDYCNHIASEGVPI